MRPPNAPHAHHVGGIVQRTSVIAGLIATFTALAAEAQESRRIIAGDDGGGGALAGTLCGIFVAPSGVNDVGGGLTSSDPVLTIQFGISRAVEDGLSCVFVRAGTYSEKITLASGVSIIGGFDANWTQNLYTVPGHATTIAAPATTAPFASVIASGLTGTAVTLANVIILGPNVSPASFGGSSYGLYAATNAAPIVLSQMRIEGGNAADGLPGVNGSNAPSLFPTAGMNGVPASPGVDTLVCDDVTQTPGSLGGVNTCAAGGASMGGGNGGPGGLADTQCSFPPDGDATNGFAGGPGAQSAFGLGTGGSGGPPCFQGQPGLQGRITNGASGSGAATLGSVIANVWVSTNGTNGGVGANGGGGGGGGGAGGCDTGTDARGAGGGGGGAGGCRAPGAGVSGTGGGGSFCVFAVSSNITLTGVEFIRGNGGDGGSGGDGGQGQLGGSGGPGAATPDGGNSGTGGNGGHGGHGGGGGGGAGGVSYAVYCSSSSIANLGVTFAGGMAGVGGAGGISAPFAPESINDGNDGAPGVSGALGGLITCGGTGPTPPATCSPDDCIVECLADVNGDGFVNVTDLLAVISAWGPCP